MKLQRYENNPILEKNLQNHWEAGSVLNPSVLYDNGIFRMVYRATNDIDQEKAGGYISSIGYAESTNGIHFTRSSTPLILPDKEYEIGLGCEDPRVTKVDGQYFLYYTAVEGIGETMKVRLALATSTDFKTWEKHGVVGPATRSKAGVLFPEKIKGKYVMFYTWMEGSPLSSIMQAKFDSLEDVKKPPKGFMGDNINHYEKNVVFKPPVNSYQGAEVGAVPIKTEAGWLFIYCNANISNHPEWAISAALLDLNDPQYILSETEEPILKPETESEVTGFVKNVTFPEGAVIVKGELYVYYGSGDQGICLATCNLNKLLKYLKSKIKVIKK
jgi:predicted GH43/DUF377 family glycosyl hydrolase